MTVNPTIALDRATLLNLAQQLEARCDPVFIGQELRKIVEAAPPAVKADIAADMVQEISTYSPCRCKQLGTCRRCRLVNT
jgi:hypothetical protein